MWKGYEEALGRYGLTCCQVWTELGFADTCAATIPLATKDRYARSGTSPGTGGPFGAALADGGRVVVASADGR